MSRHSLDARDRFRESHERLRSRRWPTIAGPVGRSVRLDGRDVVLFGSNDYLGLGSEPRVVAAAQAALDRYGSGHGMNPTLAVTSLHHELAEAMAEFVGCEDVLLFNSCTAANCAVVPTLVREGDVVVSDELNHASIIDACRLSRGTRRVYRHADTRDLESTLAAEGDAGLRVVVTDGVFSMEGEAAPLDRIAHVAGAHDAHVVVDESHAVGVVGEHGRGTAELFDVDPSGLIQTGTFSKAFGAGIGGYVAGKRELIAHLRDQARFFIFTSGMPVAAAGAALAALRLIRDDGERLARLRANVRLLREGLHQLGFRVLGDGPIVPVILGDSPRAQRVAALLLAHDIYVPAMWHPIVAEGSARLRVQLSASHSFADVDALLAILSQARSA